MGNVDSFGFGQFSQQVMVVLGDLSILADNKTLEFPEAF